jgi:hypothetical protein
VIEYVDESTGELIDLDTPDGIARALLGQQSRIGKLTGRLALATSALEGVQEQLEDTATHGIDGVTAWTWSALGPLGADMLWQRLASWVGWLRGRYPLAEQLPGCWWRHPELVEEITALHLAWRAAYSDPGALLTAPIDWHQHHLPAFLNRVRGWGVHCTDTHRERPHALYAESGVDDRADYDAFTAADVEARRAAAPSSRPTPAAAASWPELDGHRPDSETPVVCLPAEEISAALATGQAERLGPLAGAPVLLRDQFWLADGARYVRVDDEAFGQQLRRDHQRLKAANSAVGAGRRDHTSPEPR